MYGTSGIHLIVYFMHTQYHARGVYVSLILAVYNTQYDKLAMHVVPVPMTAEVSEQIVTCHDRL